MTEWVYVAAALYYRNTQPLLLHNSLAFVMMVIIKLYNTLLHSEAIRFRHLLGFFICSLLSYLFHAATVLLPRYLRIQINKLFAKLNRKFVPNTIPQDDESPASKAVFVLIS